MKKILIVIVAAKYNMGSQMLLRGISGIAKDAGADLIDISSADIKRGESLGIPFVNNYIPRFYNIFSNYFVSKIFGLLRRLTNNSDLITIVKSHLLVKNMKKYDLIILVAADNYDHTVGRNPLDVFVKYLNRMENRPKILLYDFSMKKENITKHLINTISKVDALTVRDTLSFDNLKEFASEEKIFLYSDPAFRVKASKVEFDDLYFDKDYVGLNLSALVAGAFNTDKYKKVMEAACKLIDAILMKDNLNIIFIPHVMQNADLSVLRHLYKKYKYTNRVYLISDETLNGPQLKYIISKCRFFIGARTHSTIAAYSSYVPTLVLGYSIKSLGIAKDLFGTYDNFVINVNSLQYDANRLADGFIWLYNHETEIRNKLKEIMPSYIESSEKVGQLISKLLEK